MSRHYRARYRDLVCDTLAASERFASFCQRSAGAQNISADDLPVLAVATPQESKSRDSLSTSERETTLHLALKRIGGEELESLLDEDSAAVEILLLAAFARAGVEGDLTQTEIRIDGSGEQRIGALNLSFRIVTSLDEPISENFED